MDDGTLATLAAAGISVINASPMSMSLLTSRGPPVWHPSSPALKARSAAAAAAAKEGGCDISRLALAFALAQPDIPTTMMSTSDPVSMKSNLDAVTGRTPLSPAESAMLASIRSRFFNADGDDPSYAGLASWEGAETEAYFAKVGKAVLASLYAQTATSTDVTLGGVGVPAGTFETKLWKGKA